MMRIYLRTRGELRHLDYHFLGAAPSRAWWREFGDVNAFERPCVLAVGDGADWRLYLGGIPSGRVDSVGTMIVYSLVVEGDARSASEDRDSVLRLVATWVSAIAGRPGAEALTAALDEAFPREDVEKWLTEKGEAAQDVEREVAGRVLEVSGKLPEASVIARLPEGLPARWIGGVRCPGAAEGYLDRIRRILDGEPGEAHVLNMVAEGEDVVGLQSPRLAVLIEGSGIGDATAPIRSLTFRDPGGERRTDDPKDLSGTIRQQVVRVAAVVIAAGLLAWVIYRLIRTGAPADD